MSTDYVTQHQFDQALDLLAELRDARKEASIQALEAHRQSVDNGFKALGEKIDMMKREITDRQDVANGRTSKNEAAIAALRSRVDAIKAPAVLELSAAGVKWRPSRRHLVVGGAAVGGAIGWPALLWAGKFLAGLAAGALK